MMALTKKQQKRMDKLDFSKGGGFSDFLTNANKLTPSDSKFLFVGLGGKGGEVIASLKTEVYKRIQCPPDSFRPDSFEYLAVDSDDNSLKRLQNREFGEVGLSGSPQDNEMCHLYNSDTAAILKSPGMMPENVSGWINPNLSADLAGDGAGGVRQAGRFLLFGNAFLSLKAQLERKLGRLHNQISNANNQKLIVYIFAGVGGGTGSGTIIDIPYIIREICKRKSWQVKIHAYIFLPDTYAEHYAHMDDNSYAALKEIDSLMNLSYMGGVKKFEATYTGGYSVSRSENIFDSCVLISGKRSSDTGGSVPYPDAFSRRVVVDNIISLVSQTQANGVMLANSFLDNNIVMNRNAVNQMDGRIPKNAFYQYLAVGMGAIELPLEQILAYLANGVMQKMAAGWDRHAGDQQVQAFLGRLNTRPEDLSGNMLQKSSIPLFSYKKELKLNAHSRDIENGSLYQNIKSIWLGYHVQMYAAWDQVRQTCLEEVTKKLNELYRDMFKHPNYGIYFLNELFTSRVSDGRNAFNGVKQRLESDYKDALDALIKGERTRQRQIEEEMQKVSWPNRVENYCRLCVDRLVSEDMVVLYDKYVRGCLEEILENIEVKIAQLKSYIDIFAKLRAIVEENYRLVMEGRMPHAEYTSVLLDFSRRHDDDSTGKIVQYLDQMLAQKTEEGLVTNLEEKLLNTEQKWLGSEEDFDPMTVFVRFLEGEFSNLSLLTLNNFLTMKYNVQDLGHAITEIGDELKSKAAVIFPTIETFPCDSLEHKNYVVVPAGAGAVTAGITAYAGRNGVIVATGTDRNRVYWYNLVTGLPLFALPEISEYEKAYERCLPQTNSTLSPRPGMHIQESREENWAWLPQLTNQDLWERPDFNIRERNYAEQVKTDTEKFLEAGLISQEDGSYVAYGLEDGNVTHTREALLEWCRGSYLQNPEVGADGRIDSGKGLFTRMRKENSLKQFPVELNTIYFRMNEENLYKGIRMQEFLYRKLCETWQAYEACRALAEEENRKQEEKQKSRENLRRFAEYVKTGIVVLGKDAVYLKDRKEEEFELFYYDDHIALERQHFVYYACESLARKFPEEQIEELDDYRAELLGNRDPEIRKSYTANIKGLDNEIVKSMGLLKKLETKREMERAGRLELMETLNRFYEELRDYTK